YYVRVKVQGSNEWSEWSEPLEIKEKDTFLKPTITASGSTYFPTLDGATSVVLSAPGYADYRWSNGQNGGASQSPYHSNHGPGYRYVQVLEPDGCWSSLSDTVY